MLAIQGLALPVHAPSGPLPGRLTVRPRAMAIGTRNPGAGEHSLDSLPGYLVYVSSRCAGARRCPLVLLLGGGGYGARTVMDMHAQHAEKYGMILLAPEPVTPGKFELISDYYSGENNLKTEPAIKYPIGERPTPEEPYLVRKMPNAPDFRNIDAAMKQVLRTYAIDPARIAVAGMSNGGSYTLFLGLSNLDVFSRIAPLSPSPLFTGTGPRGTANQFFVSGGIDETRFWKSALIAARDIRSKGIAADQIKQVLALRGHENFVEDHDLMWRWLRDSWATPNPARRSAPPAAADPLPLLTADAVARVTAFWTAFVPAQEWMWAGARQSHLKEFTVPIGQTRMSVLMADVAVLAAQYPSVAAALAATRLTASQYQAYRAALISAYATRQLGDLAGAVDSASVLGKNIAFLDAHPDEIAALKAKGMWTTP